jgi:hypothetical protein
MAFVQIPEVAASARERDAAILDLLRARGRMAAEEVAALLDAAPYLVAASLRQLERTGRVVCLGHAARPGGRWGGARWVALWAARPHHAD